MGDLNVSEDHIIIIYLLYKGHIPFGSIQIFIQKILSVFRRVSKRM